MLPVPLAVFIELQLSLGILAILRGRIVAPVALGALQSYEFQIFRFSFGHMGLPAGG
jgi:hypothetical protein